MQNTLEEMLNDCKLLCLDEFHVHDIGDAMLINRMLKTILERDRLLLTTSNYPPEGLLPNPLYHDRFLPTIQLIEAHMDIISLAGAIDYRSLGNFNANAFSQGAFLSLGNAQQRAQFSLPSPGQSLLQLTVNDRGLTVISAHSDTLQLSFSDICETTTATMDYLALVNIYSRWVIEDIPKISSTSEAAQQRFINLVNVLYDRRCEVFMTSPLSTSVTIDH